LVGAGGAAGALSSSSLPETFKSKTSPDGAEARAWWRVDRLNARSGSFASGDIEGGGRKVSSLTVVGFGAHIYASRLLGTGRNILILVTAICHGHRSILGSRKSGGYELYIKDYKKGNEPSRTVSGDEKTCPFTYIIGVTRAIRKCWDKRTTERSVELPPSAVSWFDLEVPEGILSELVLVIRASIKDQRSIEGRELLSSAVI